MIAGIAILVGFVVLTKPYARMAFLTIFSPFSVRTIVIKALHGQHSGKSDTTLIVERRQKLSALEVGNRKLVEYCVLLV
ncbi:MAG: hypothetical protein AB8B95_15790 [Pseudohongiellaceae bacterium]